MNTDKKKYLLANWKSHKNTKTARAWLLRFAELYQPAPHVGIILAAPFVHLPLLAELRAEHDLAWLSLAAQDISPFPAGAYTGAVCGEMLQGLVEYVMVGHSERRRHFHETLQEVANKVREATAASMTTILCLDLDYAQAQIAALHHMPEKLLIGYGPVEAIGVTIPQSLQGAAAGITSLGKLAPGVELLYGGSVRPDNAASYAAMAGVSGLMVGGASLDAHEFASICTEVAAVFAATT